jgi:adenosylcobyric acid synthase
MDRRAKAIAVLGTGSDVGKSVIVAGVCRLVRRAGLTVAPFKAQNMSLNSFVTPEGGEIGRAQALQAEACDLPPHVDMNPILLKPESDWCAQVIVHGKLFAKLTATAYFGDQGELVRAIEHSYERLAARYDVVVIEGAGSAAEVNLRARDLVNWPVVKLADAPVLLVADIDRGGVFAQVIGTLDLLAPEERKRVCGIVINRFRGDASLFADGVSFLEERTGVPVLGVVPFVRDLALDQEDALDKPAGRSLGFSPERVNIAVVLLPHMSNFTDFNALGHEPDVALSYVSSPSQLAGADAVILPGSKNTLADLAYVREKEFVAALTAHTRAGKELVGICGGYQMLGRWIADPHGVEGGGTAPGLAFLRGVTELQQNKLTAQVEATPVLFPHTEPVVLRGYQIHMGVTSREGDRPCFRVWHRGAEANVAESTDSRDDGHLDGAMTSDGLVWGTYIHGLYDHPGFRRAWLNRLRERKGLSPLHAQVSEGTTRRMGGEIDRWADHLTAHLNMPALFKCLHLEC